MELMLEFGLNKKKVYGLEWNQDHGVKLYHHFH
jgi:hypothetical protein